MHGTTLPRQAFSVDVKSRWLGCSLKSMNFGRHSVKNRCNGKTVVAKQLIEISTNHRRKPSTVTGRWIGQSAFAVRRNDFDWYRTRRLHGMMLKFKLTAWPRRSPLSVMIPAAMAKTTLQDRRRSFAVNGKPTRQRLLVDGDTISIGRRGRMKFRRPVAASGSAVLELTSGQLNRVETSVVSS